MKLDDNFVEITNYVFDSCCTGLYAFDRLGLANDYFKNRKKAKMFIYLARLVLISYQSASSIVINYGDCENCGVIIRSSLEASVTYTLLTQNKDLILEFIKFDEFFVQNDKQNTDIINYARSQNTLDKKGKLIHGYQKYGWINKIKGNETNKKFDFKTVTKCLKKESEENLRTYCSYKGLSDLVHQMQVFGRCDENQPLFNSLNVMVPTLRYIFQSLEIIIPFQNSEIDEIILKLQTYEKKLPSIADKYF